MPGAARVGTDTAGGTQLGGGQGSVYVDGALWVVRGDAVASHPPCPRVPVHCAATMAGASATVFAGGIPVCREGDTATCGHASTGSATVFAG